MWWDREVGRSLLLLCGRPLPWVERAEHLGHAIHMDGTAAQDCCEKRAHFIDSSVKIRESFGFTREVLYLSVRQ